MSANRVAVRYARAFIEALREKDAMAEADAFLAFCDMAEKHDELSRLFANVTVSAGNKEKVVGALAEKAGLPALATNFLCVLASGGRLNILAQVRIAVARAMDDLSNIKTVELTTAVAVSEEEVAQFVAGMKNVLGCEVRVTPRTDADILGGAIARVDSLVYDGSVRAQLDRLRAELVKEN